MKKLACITQTIKVFIALILCQISTYYLQLPVAFIAPITVLVLMTLFHTEIIRMASERLLGPLFCTAVALICLHYLPHNLGLYSLCIFLLCCICFYAYSVRCFFYANLLGGLTISLILSVGFSVSKHAAFLLGVGWVGHIFIAGIIAVLVNQLLWPNNTKEPTKEVVQALQKTYLSLFIDWINAVEQCKKSPVKRQQNQLDQAELTLSNLFEEADPSDIQAHKKPMHNMAIVLANLWDNYSSDESPHDTMLLAQDLLKNVKQHYLSFLRSKVHATQAEQINAFDSILHDTISALRQDPRFRVLPGASRARLINNLVLIKHFNLAVQEILEIPADATKKQAPAYFRLIKTYIANNLSLLRAKKPAFKQAIKMSVTLLCITLVNIHLDWQSITVQALIAATVITAQPNLGRAYARLFHRCAGILMGGATGILIMMLGQLIHSVTFIHLSMIIALTTAAYFLFKTPKYFYVFLQAGLMLPLILMLTPNGFGSANIAIERFLGLLEGAGISLLFLYFIWPAHPLKLIAASKRAFYEATSRYLNAIANNQVTTSPQTSYQIINEIHLLIIDSNYIPHIHTRNKPKKIYSSHALQNTVAALENITVVLQSGKASSILQNLLIELKPNLNKIAYALKTQNTLALQIQLKELVSCIVHRRILEREDSSTRLLDIVALTRYLTVINNLILFKTNLSFALSTL